MNVNRGVQLSPGEHVEVKVIDEMQIFGPIVGEQHELGRIVREVHQQG